MGIHRERMHRPAQGMKMGLNVGPLPDSASFLKSGKVIFDLRDSRTGEQLAYWERDNLIVLDAGIIAARLFRGSLYPDPNTAPNPNGLFMLAVGTGAAGNALSPDAPQATQRALNAEIARKAFAAVPQYRNQAGMAVSYPTNIVDFTTTFAEGEAVGALNEMGLICPNPLAPGTPAPIPNGAGTLLSYDPTTDVNIGNAGGPYDLLANYLPFGSIGKNSLSVLSISWRLSF